MTTRATASPALRAREIAPILKALSDENRLTLLLAIADRDCTVTELADVSGKSQPLVSHHLKTLRETKSFTSTAVGRSNVYSLCCEAIAEPIALLSDLATPSCSPKG